MLQQNAAQTAPIHKRRARQSGSVRLDTADADGDSLRSALDKSQRRRFKPERKAVARRGAVEHADPHAVLQLFASIRIELSDNTTHNNHQGRPPCPNSQRRWTICFTTR